MATVSRISKVKVPALNVAKDATFRTGHPRVSSALSSSASPSHGSAHPNEAGRFGAYGGRYVPETLMAALEELESAYEKAKHDKKFQARLDELLKTYAGRPTPLFLVRRLT
jgi:hypothetical protein